MNSKFKAKAAPNAMREKRHGPWGGTRDRTPDGEARGPGQLYLTSFSWPASAEQHIFRPQKS